jgi:hypothetical protein
MMPAYDVANEDSYEVRFQKGREGRVSLAAKPLTPAERFQQTVVCQGELLEMRRSHGWIRSFQAVEHPSAHWNHGRIYLSTEDLRPGVALRPGDVVVFYLYADSEGLGAEDVFPVRASQPAGLKAHPSKAISAAAQLPQCSGSVQGKEELLCKANAPASPASPASTTASVPRTSKDWCRPNGERSPASMCSFTIDEDCDSEWGSISVCEHRPGGFKALRGSRA